MWKTAFKTASALLIFSVVHSLLASRQAKGWAGQMFGERARNAFYRPFYLLQSLVGLGLLWAFVRPLPDRTLYHLRGWQAALLRVGQLSGMIYATTAAMQIGLARILGIEGLVAWLRGDKVILPTPEAQGPAPDPQAPGIFQANLKVSGPFKAQRHPLNFAPLLVFWLNPWMNIRLLSYNLGMTLYLVLGSLHEEYRLKKAYGRAYRSYQRSGVPFYLPRLHS